MAGKILEAKAIITAEDRTAKVFAEIEARVLRLNKSMAGLSSISSKVARMGGYAGGQEGGSGRGGSGGLPVSPRALAARAGASRSRQLVEAEEMKAYRRQVAGGISGGFVGLGAGLAAGFAVHEVAKASADRVHERVRMEVSGMSADETRKAEVAAAKIAADFPAIGQTEVMHMLRNARSIVGSYSEAAEIMEPLAKLRIIAQGARPGQDVSEDFDQLVKGLEIKGVTQNPKQFHEYMEGIAKGLNVFGDTLKPYQYYEMFKYGRQATPGLSERFMLGTAPTLAQELGGSSYGNAVSGFNRSIVGGRMEHPAYKEMARLGLIKHDDLDWLKTGEAKGLKPGRHVQGWELAQSDPNEWVKRYLLPAMQNSGINDPSKIMQEIGTLFTNRMSAQLVSLLATQQSRIDKDMALLDHARGLSAADDYMSKDPKVAWSGLEKAIEGLTATLGSDWAASLAPIMNDLGKAIANYTKILAEMYNYRQDNPDKASEGQKKINRKLNKLVFGVDSEEAAPDVTDAQKLDADYNEKRQRIIDRIATTGGQKKANRWFNALTGGSGDAASDGTPYTEGDQLKAQLEAQLAALDASHDARVQAEEKLRKFLRERPVEMGPGRLNQKVSPFIAGARPGEGPNGLAFPGTTGPGSFAGSDVTTGGIVTHALPSVAQPPAAPDLGAMLNGKIEASVKPDQITAKLEGQASVGVQIGLSGAGAELFTLAKSASAAGHLKLNLGESAPDTAPGRGLGSH